MSYQPKFRQLTDEELQELEKEFVQFLCANTVTADDWVKVKEEEPERAHQLIDMFSDVVMEKALTNIKYLEHRQEKELMLFHCKEESMELIGLNVPADADVDLREPASVQAYVENSEDGGLSVFKVEKPYAKSREEEMFDMTNTGCLVSDGALFYLLEKMV